MTIRRRILACVAVLLAAGATPLSAEFLASPPGAIVDLPTRPGITLRYAVFAPDAPPAAAVILFVGGEGRLNIPEQPGPTWQNAGNFLTRSREYFRRRGLYVVVVDAPSDHSHGLVNNFRISADHAEDIAAVIADVRKRAAGAPVWLIGTSRGSISAANVAARLQGPHGADGVILTSSVSRPGRGGGGQDTVFDADLSAIRVPTLVVYHRADGCEFVGDAPRVLAKLSRAPRKEIVAFDGGDPPRTTACEPLAAHGYFGIEERVANAIADWILAPQS